MGIVGIFYFGLMLETPLVKSIFSAQILSIYLMMLLSGSGLVYFNLKKIPTTQYQPNKDLQQLGQISYFWKYWLDEQQTIIDTTESPFSNKPSEENQQQANIVVVQSESFFDPRSYFELINKEALKHFDSISNEAKYSGRLDVPAWGANTVRTECGFLSALPAEKMGVHQFNPYRFLANNKIPNLVSQLKQQGYLTICIHPYPVSFYQRDKVFPKLGFDRFIDIKDFSPEQKSGQYIGDLAVSDKINELLDNASSQPLFIFAITMENHGPLHLENPTKEDIKAVYNQPPAENSEDLTVYLKHLKNADLMIDQLKQGMLKRDKQTLLCWYGDHVPIMPKVYQAQGTPDGGTDYFIWDSANYNKPANKQDISIHQLASLLTS
jgi:phosphoglycerol transferase MdoB-like AlkP superfamily enzyme